MSHRPKRLATKRPEWATWQGRLAWALDRAAEAYPSYSEASLHWGFARTQLKTWRKRLGAGGDLQFSTLLVFQKHLRLSWEWIASGDGWPTPEVARVHGAHLRSVPPNDDDDS